MERLTVVQASMIQPLVRALVAIGLALSLVGLSPSAGQVDAADVPLVLHDCLLVFRYGNDAHYGVTLRGSEARDVNNLGEIVGWTATETGAVRATLWSGGEQTDLGTLGGENSCALGINDAGQVVGWAETEEAEPHAVRWENGVPTDLGALPGEISVAFAINELGQAAGLS
ncbi:MAG: hypothetical protein IT336_14290, partial [Thermomicrobiales bacterium]|nr:hypothetical protein [Thermomicrobiales bacterium]